MVENRSTDVGSGVPTDWALDYDAVTIGASCIIHADCFEWMSHLPENCIHAIVTDPPFGVKEYDLDQLEKMRSGSGGVWRIPPSFDGNQRAPLPRFTALDDEERGRLYRFFVEWARLAERVLLPGGHVIIAAAPVLAPLVLAALVEGGLEFRGQIIRTVRTLRGGDRPKNAEAAFPDVCSMPRGCHEPWGLLRKPLGGMRVSDCLSRYGTGGLRRFPDGGPFCDLIESGRAPQDERAVADHPTLKPQALMRQLVYAALPLGEGVVLDPFMGSGSTIAAGEAVGVKCVGVERHREYFEMAKSAIPALARMTRDVFHASQTQLPL